MGKNEKVKKTVLKNHFIHCSNTNAEGESLHIQLLKKGDILVSCHEQEESADEKRISPAVYKLEAATNTELASDSMSILSMVTGYPHLEEKRSGKNIRVIGAMLPFVQISSDKMFATLRLQSGMKLKDPPNSQDIINYLNAEGVVWGIDQIAVEKCAAKLVGEIEEDDEIIVARGILPVHGQDAYFRFSIDVGPFPGKLLKNGTMDFRERKLFVGVEERQLIAEKISPSEGTPGKNLLGEEIAQKPGRDIKILATGDVEINADNGQIFAKSSGVLSITNGNNIKVSAKTTISGDVDFSTGNIESLDCVEISGSVKSGFSVTARGDVEIGGVIDNGSIQSKSNVSARSGLIGEKSLIKARGDAEVLFVENGRVETGGNVLIKKECYYSFVKSDSQIICDEKSTVVASHLIAGNSLNCFDIGTPNSDKSILCAGVDGERFRKKRTFLNQREELFARQQVLLQRYGREVEKKKEYRKNGKALNRVKQSIATLNLIPSTPEFSRGEPLKDLTEASITVMGKVLAGTELWIGNIHETLEDDYSQTRFQLDELRMKINAISIEE